ncbi:MAG: phytase [Bacteroidia bacterium]|nr:phytase [Bacteroidia bacterium]
MDCSEEIPGIDVVSKAAGDIYPKGIFICQDGFNKDG